MRPGLRILAHAIVERVVGSHVIARVGDGLVTLIGADIAGRTPDTIEWCGNTWTVHGRDDGHHWLGRGGMRISVRDDLIFSEAQR